MQFMELWFKLCSKFFTAWRKAIRAIWKLPFRTHCNLLHSINDTLPIDVMLEQTCIKLIWTKSSYQNSIITTLLLSILIKVGGS